MLPAPVLAIVVGGATVTVVVAPSTALSLHVTSLTTLMLFSVTLNRTVATARIFTAVLA